MDAINYLSRQMENGMIAGQMPRGVVVTSTCRMDEACSGADILSL
jgi:hypothetical protein